MVVSADEFKQLDDIINPIICDVSDQQINPVIIDDKIFF